MKIIIAKIISLFFNPAVFFLIMPFLVVYRYSQSGFYALKWEIFSSIFLFLGILLFFIGRYKGTFSDEDISIRKERYKFYVLLYSLGFIYFILSLFLKGIFFPLSIISFGIILGVLIFNLVNYYAKASIHTGVVCAFVISIGFMYGFNFFLGLLWMVPLIVWSRIVTKNHTLKETILGGFLGGIITLVTFFIGREIYKF